MAGYKTLTKFGRTYILNPNVNREGHIEQPNFHGTKCALMGVTRKGEDIEEYFYRVNKQRFQNCEKR